MAVKLLFAVLFSLLFFCDAMPSYDVKLSDVFFEGGFVFFPVKRSKLQDKLNEINSYFENEADRLFLPSEPVLQHAIAADEHVIMVGYGSMDAVAFDDALTDAQKQTESTLIEAVNIAIPYLTTQNGEKEKISFQMDLFVAEGGYHIESNVVLPPPIVADFLYRCGDEESTFVSLVKDDLQLQLFSNHQVPCVPHCEKDIGDISEYEHELQISLSGPDFSICHEISDLQVDLCNVYRDSLYNSVLEKEETNVCQYWVPTEDVQTCDSSVRVVAMSEAMREFLLLEEGATPIEGLSVTGTFDIRLVFPCIE